MENRSKQPAHLYRIHSGNCLRKLAWPEHSKRSRPLPQIKKSRVCRLCKSSCKQFIIQTNIFTIQDRNCLPSAGWEQLMLNKVFETTTHTTGKIIIPQESMPVVPASAGVVVLLVCILVVAYMSHKKGLSIRRRVQCFKCNFLKCCNYNQHNKQSLKFYQSQIQKLNHFLLLLL
jgi:hypothetical protein